MNDNFPFFEAVSTSPDGSIFEEKFRESFEAHQIFASRPAGAFDIARNVIKVDDINKLSRSIVNVRFPLTENHPSFGCTLDVMANSGSGSTFECG